MKFTITACYICDADYYTRHKPFYGLGFGQIKQASLSLHPQGARNN